MYTIINAVILSVATLVGVWLGGRQTKNNNLKLEKQFLIKKIEIDKTQELIKNLLDYGRIIGKMRANIANFVNKEIDHGEFTIINDELQEEGTIVQRTISSNEVFNMKLEPEIEAFIEKYIRVCDKIYEKYHNPKTNHRFYSDEEIHIEVIGSDIEECLLCLDKAVKTANEKLKGELEELKHS